MHPLKKESYKKNIRIKGLDNLKLKKNEYIFHAGTKIEDNSILATGGRVLNFVVRSKNFKDGREKAIKLINNLKWDNGFFRKDIAYKVINE